MSTSTETRIPTQTFLLPGQQFCIGMPWERASLPVGGLPPAAPKLAAAKLTLRDEKERADPCEGWELGNCRVLRRLSDGSARTLLAIRTDDTDGPHLVVMRKLELPRSSAARRATTRSGPRVIRTPTWPASSTARWVTKASSGSPSSPPERRSPRSPR